MSLAQLNPFNYHVSEIVKAVIAFIGFGGYVAAIFIMVEPGLVEAVSALVIPAAGVITVFAWGNHDASAFNKAFVALITAAITVADYWHKISPSTESKLFVAAGALATVLGVLFKANAPVGSVSARARGAVSQRTQHRA